jgi:hypothetical protein
MKRHALVIVVCKATSTASVQQAIQPILKSNQTKESIPERVYQQPQTGASL